jgi:KRAB domain-containing zinc finger protein
MCHCRACDRHFSDKFALQDHHCEGHPMTHKCDHCPTSFTSRSGLILDVQNSHLQSYRMLCDHCSRGFNLKEEFEAHMAIHTRVKKHGCACGKRYPHISHLNRHKKVCKINATAVTTKCSTCCKVFKTKDYMELHVANVHTSPGSFQCSKCGKCFNHNPTLFKHHKNCN